MDGNNIGNFWINCVRSVNKELNGVVERDLRIVERIDAQIMQLVTQRNYILHGLNNRCLAHQGVQSYLGADAMTVWKEYLKDGFKGSEVKSAVSRLRSMFFDDSKEKFQKFFCTQINYNEYSLFNNYIYFIFEDEGGHAMRFAFDIKMHEDEHLYKNKYLNGRAYFQVLNEREFYTVNMSFDVDEMRKAIEDWVDGGFEFKEHNLFEHDTLIDKVTDNFKDFERMRTYDAYRGSTVAR